MKKSLIAFDLDDVIVDSTEYWRVELNKRTGLSLDSHHWKEPGQYSGYYTRLWQKHGIDNVISTDIVDAEMAVDQSGLRPMAEAYESLEVLSENHAMVIVTARNVSLKTATQAWLEQYFPGIFDTIVFANGPKGFAQKNKGEICKEIGAEWLVDDNPGHCQLALEQGVKAILFGEYGWHVEVPEDMVKCKTWPDLKEYFGAI